MTGMLTNMLANGDVEGCLSIMMAQSESTDVSEDEEV